MTELSFNVTGFEQGGLSNGEPVGNTKVVRSDMKKIPAGMQSLTAVPEIWRKKWDSKNESYTIEKYEGSSASSTVHFYRENDDGTFEFLSYASANNVDCLQLKHLGATHARFTAGVGSSAIHPDDMEETKSYYYYIVQIDVSATAVNWYYSNDRLTHEEMPDAPEKAMTKPYPKALWRVENDRLTHEILPDTPEKAMMKPYPKALWRMDRNLSPNMPYHELLPTIKGYNIWSLPRENVIRVYDYSEPQKGFRHNGLAILKPSECTSTHELNGRWDVTLTHPIDEWGRWKYIIPNNVLKIDGQLFRIDEHESVSDSSGMYVKIHAKHIWYDLADKIIFQKKAENMNGQQFMNFIFDAHYYATGTYDEYEFQHNSDISKNVDYVEIDNETITSAFIGNNTSFINLFGGELYRNNFYFSINERMEGAKDNAFTLKYGFDMTKISQKIDCNDWYTHIHFENNYGETIGISWGNETWTVHHNRTKHIKMYYNSPDYARFQRDCDELFLKTAFPKVTYEINIASLRNDPKYKDFINLQNYNLGDRGIIYCSLLDIKTTQQIVSIEKNELTGDIKNIKLGNLRNSLIRPSYAWNNVSNGNNAIINAMQNQLEELHFREYITRPIVTVDGKYLQTSNKKFLQYKEG